jgi:hypothetical protein
MSGAVSSVNDFSEALASSMRRPMRITAYAIAIAMINKPHAAIIVATPPGPVTIDLTFRYKTTKLKL